MAAEPSDELVSAAEAARILRVSVPTIKRWLKDGRLPAYHLGPRYIRIRRADLQQVLTPLREEVSPMKERPRQELSRIGTDLPMQPLTEEQVKQALEAMQAAALLRQEMKARRGGKELAPSWPLVRATREERPPRYE